MSQIGDHVLLADIGGTHARFAIFQSGRLGAIESLHVADYRTIADALRAFLASRGDLAAISGAILAVAGPVEDNRCTLTNAAWVIDGNELRAAFGWRDARVVNDFEALAWSLPDLAPGDVSAIGAGRPKRSAPALVIGPGTGLGLACRIPHGDGALVVTTEGGHVTMPGTSRREDLIIDHLRERVGHVSAERILSGEGLVNLYQAIGAIDKIPTTERDAAAITSGALDGSCPICREALDIFCAMLGTVAGDAALTFKAGGGVYIAGGIVPRFVDYLAGSSFRARFEAKGRFCDYLAAIPICVITHAEPAFIGLQALAREVFNP